MELVTGFAGTAHIDPVDFAHLNAAAFGPDAYLLDTQNKLEASLETANKLVIDTGDLMIQGHHFTVVESEEVALQSGVSGQKRNALVCARYEKAEGTGVESASWIVKYGPATTGTPADPTVTSGDILDGNASVHEEPIFRIEYDGITPGNPILLVPEFQPASKFRDSISQFRHYEATSSSFAEIGDIYDTDRIVILAVGNKNNDRIINSVTAPAQWLAANNTDSQKILITNYSKDADCYTYAYFSNGKIYAQVGSPSYFKGHVFVY